MPDHSDPSLLTWIANVLRQPARPGDRARGRLLRQRVMDAVRQEPAPRAALFGSAPMAASRWRGGNRRGWLSPLGGFATTALLLIVTLFRAGTPERRNEGVISGIETDTHVLGDSVVPVSGSSVSRSSFASDTAQRLLDTLRIVEFVLRGSSSIRSASVLGAFNAWQRGVTPLLASGRNEWRARILVPRDALRSSQRVAYLVNESQLVTSP